jgi:hypothetical protein
VKSLVATYIHNGRVRADTNVEVMVRAAAYSALCPVLLAWTTLVVASGKALNITMNIDSVAVL